MALLVVGLLLVAGSYAYDRLKKGAAPSEQEQNDGSPLVKVNESAVSIYLGDLDPTPALSQLTLRIYAPGLGHVDRPLAAPPQAGIYLAEGLFPGVDLAYHDLNNDSAAGNGDYFTVVSEEGPLRQGIWHAEINYPGHRAGEVSFRIHVLPPGTQSIAENAEVVFIDVGQGDAELIRTSDGRNILIDAGPPGAEDDLLSDLSNRSITVLDALIISHPDADHLGGAEEVLQALEVRSVYHPGLARNTTSYRSFIAAALAEGCPIYTSGDVDAGDYLDLSVTEDFRVLSINASADVNDASIVIRMTAQSRSFLFTGDIGIEVENTLRSTYLEELDVDVLKVAHHGSAYSSSAAFLNAVTPLIAVIEVGQNTYGHPTDEALARLSAAHAVILRTDLVGDHTERSEGGVVR